jgi:serine protease
MGESGTVITSAEGSGVVSVTAPSDGTFVVLLAANGDDTAFNYVMTIGSNSPAQTNGWSLEQDFVPGELIVEFKEAFLPLNKVPSVQSRAQSIGMKALGGGAGRAMLMSIADQADKATAFNALGVSRPLVAADPDKQLKLDTLVAAVALQQRADVESVRLNYIFYPTAVPNDEFYSSQWHYPLINLPQAWDTTTGSADVVVAVIDTGILSGHPDLQGQLVGGYDFISDNTNSADGQPGIDPNPEDPGDGTNGSPSSFHGTHVAGTIAAASNNNIGVSGVAWQAKIMPLRALGLFGGTSYDIEQAIRFAAGLPNDSGTVPAQPADVINLSLGGPAPSNNPATPTAYRLARQAGLIIVAAAGNSGTNELNVPSGYDGVVSVSAVNNARRLASYSSFGPTIDVAAPGGDSNGRILSTVGSDVNGPIQYTYGSYAGTSMASPHVAGVAALMKSVYPGLTPEEFDTLLVAGQLTQDLGTAGRDNSYGYGLIDANKAVLAAVNAGGGGAPPPKPPALQVAPTEMNFGAVLTDAELSVANSGEGTLTVNSVTEDSGGWLSVSPANTDGNGVGTYSVSVDRSTLNAGVYSATITVASDAGEASVAVTMQVITVAVEDNAGPQIIQLFNKTSPDPVDSVKVLPVNGIYDYTFTNVPPGTYNIRSSSDLDNDGVLCELGEACGAYPTLDSTVSADIVVDGATAEIPNLDFETGYSVNLPAQ